MLKSCLSRLYRIFFSDSDDFYAVYKGWREKMHNPVVRKKIKVNYCKNALTNYVMWCIVLSKSKIITIKINIKFFTII